MMPNGSPTPVCAPKMASKPSSRWGGLIVAVTCPTEVILERAEPDPKNATTPEGYEEMLQLDNSKDVLGSHTQWCIDRADYYIDNSGTVAETHNQINEIVHAHAR